MPWKPFMLPSGRTIWTPPPWGLPGHALRPQGSRPALTRETSRVPLAIIAPGQGWPSSRILRDPVAPHTVQANNPW